MGFSWRCHCHFSPNQCQTKVLYVPAGYLLIEKALVAHNVAFRVTSNILDYHSYKGLTIAQEFFPLILGAESFSVAFIFYCVVLVQVYFSIGPLPQLFLLLLLFLVLSSCLVWTGKERRSTKHGKVHQRCKWRLEGFCYSIWNWCWAGAGQCFVKNNGSFIMCVTLRKLTMVAGENHEASSCCCSSSGGCNCCIIKGFGFSFSRCRQGSNATARATNLQEALQSCWRPSNKASRSASARVTESQVKVGTDFSEAFCVCT